MKIMTKYISIKEIVKGAPNDIQHQNNTHRKTVMGCSWPMHNVTSYLYPYYDIDYAQLYN